MPCERDVPSFEGMPGDQFIGSIEARIFQLVMQM